VNRTTELVSTNSIVVADRLREDFGDISGLAESIREHGLLHPLTIDQDNKLIAGERRLRAMKELGFLEVEVRRWSLLDENERREIELEENIRRKDLTSFERSKNLVELAQVAKEVAAQEVFTDSVKTPKGGRPPKSLVPEAKVAERIGVPAQTIRDAKKHVAAAETYPVLQKPGWKAYQAMEAAEVIEKLPEEDRQPVARLIDQPGIPPDKAISMLRNVASQTQEERKEVVKLAQSTDSRDRTLAITKAAKVPPMPDERIAMLGQAERHLQKAISTRPTDPEASELKEMVSTIRRLIRSMEGNTHGVRTQDSAA